MSMKNTPDKEAGVKGSNEETGCNTNQKKRKFTEPQYEIQKAQKLREHSTNSGVAERMYLLTTPAFTVDDINQSALMEPQSLKGRGVKVNNGDKPESHFLDKEGNFIQVIPNVLNKKDRVTFIENASRVPREQTGKGPFITPRLEVCYSSDDVYTYGGTARPTFPFPPHVTNLSDKIIKILSKPNGTTYLDLSHLKLDVGADIEYSPTFSGGGSIGEHSDDEYKANGTPVWIAVVSYSLGQTRTMIIRSKNPHEIVAKVPLKDNSAVCMCGPTFQEKYTHAINKLNKSRPKKEIGIRVAETFRYVNQHLIIATQAKPQ